MIKFLNGSIKQALPALAALAVAALMASTGAVAGPDCSRHPEHPSCGDGGGGGDTPARYTAALTMGGFRFNPVDITINNRDTGYSSAFPLNMSRPGTAAVPANQQDWQDGDDLMWDEVFLACYEVLGGGQVDGVYVSTDWGITQGGKKQSNTARNIRITLRGVVADGFPDVDIDIGLITWNEFDRSAFLPALGQTSVYPLDTAKIYGDDISNHLSCNSGEFPLSKPASLEISRLE